jgi:murein DD-endopeptidase MepM/ murein hydrolase activator NlpD
VNLTAALAAVLIPLALHLVPPQEITFPTDPFRVEYVDSFGYPRVGHRHKGNDLMADKMTPVYASAPGTVAVVALDDTAGRYLNVDHGDGLVTRYYHLNNDDPGTDNGDADWSLTVVVEEGAHVEAGQLIGYVGDSGNAEGTPPHLHYEIRLWGEALDPYEILREAQRKAIHKAIDKLVREWWASFASG